MKFLDNTYLTIFVSIITVWALFGDDIRILATGKSGDIGFYIMIILCFAVFAVEILLSTYAKPEYIFSFFFWLDLISTVTLLLDVGWISDVLFGTSSDDSGGSGNSEQIAKAAKASQVGTRAARVIRIIRLIRLIRIVKLYKAAEKERLRKDAEDKQKKKDLRKRIASNINSAKEAELKSISDNFDKHNESDENQIPGDSKRRVSEAADSLDAQLPLKGGRNSVMPLPSPGGSQSKFDAKSESRLGNPTTPKKGDSAPQVDEEDIMDQVKESNVGKELISNITKIVIVVILMIMFSVALFSSDTYIADEYNAQKAALKQLER